MQFICNFLIGIVYVPTYCVDYIRDAELSYFIDVELATS